LKSLDLYSLFIGSILGAMISLLFTIFWEYFRDIRFWFFITRKLKGDYSVILKNGHLYPDENITWAKVTKARGREISFEMELKKPDFGNSKGKINFSTSNFGQGWYQHTKEKRYGFVELIIMSNEQLAFYRKYTTDDDKKENSFKSIETSFIWIKKR
jgi:hypothetical protein